MQRWLAAVLVAGGAALAACSGGRSDPSGDGGVELHPTGDGILVLTTNEIRASSRSLDRFVWEKQRRNFRVTVVTEDAYGGAAEERGAVRAQRIRAWLQEHRKEFTYLLLIGDGHPEHGDVPMNKVWPRHAMPENLCGNSFETDCRWCLTDAMYSNLSGNWDLNGNGRSGEQGLDDGAGGIDFTPELIVGRMPVFFGSGEEADAMLEHAIAYMNQPRAQTAWRKRVLMPAALFYLKGQPLANATVPEMVDGASTAEWFVHNVLQDSGFSWTRMYEQQGVTPSSWPSDVALSEDNLVSAWSEGQGVVFWFGHGLQREVARVVWYADKNDNGAADNQEIGQPLFLRSTTLERLPGDKPAFVVAVSCEVGNAANPYHLAQSALLNGAAVGVLASSSVTPGDGTVYTDPGAAMDTQGFGGTNAGIEVLRAVIAGEAPAKAYAQARTKLGTSADAEAWAGRMMLNWFGDPTLRLESAAEDAR